MLAGRPVLSHTLGLLEKHPRIELVILVLPEEHIAYGEMLVGGLWPNDGADAYLKVRFVVSGGDDRQGSVANGLAALAAFGWEGPVLIHDGVRPCTPPSVFDRVIEGVLSRGNAVAAIPVRDTIKRAGGDGTVLETLDRSGLWQIQTPQGFWMRELLEAYHEGRRRKLQVTDDAALLESLGHEVYLVEGDPASLKLTYPGDAVLLEALLRIQE
jgi:2-C-methyl-D-erythritol 4-phosphate cytidylyltransferase